MQAIRTSAPKSVVSEEVNPLGYIRQSLPLFQSITNNSELQRKAIQDFIKESILQPSEFFGKRIIKFIIYIDSNQINEENLEDCTEMRDICQPIVDSAAKNK